MRIILFISLFFIVIAGIAQEQRLFRFPTISEESVIFSYAGDLYKVSVNGGVAQRLTADAGYEMFSKMSPDGKTLAFTAEYDGNTEVYSMAVTGGAPKRITYTATVPREGVGYRMGPNNIVMAWTPDGSSIVYRSRMHGISDFLGKLYKVSKNGGMPEELPFSAGGFCSFSPDGKQLAFNRVFREFRTWKYYQGGMADDIWIYDFNTKTTQNITSNKAQDIQPMWVGNKIFFLSDRDRTMNLFEYDLASKQTVKVTQFTDYDIKFPSANNGRIVFEQAGYLWVYDTALKQLKKLDITVYSDNVYSRPTLKDASKNMNSYAVSPDGKRVIIGARGDIFSVPAKEGVTKNLTGSSGAHDKSACWAPDGKKVAYLSDRTGEFEIFMQGTDASSLAEQITKNADTYKYDLLWSPDSKKILWDDKMNRIQFVDIETKAVTSIEKSGYGEISGYAWSPDSKWIVYMSPQANSFQRVKLYHIESKRTVDVTDQWYDAMAPVFSSDGKYLLFVSKREFNPTYNDVEWNVSYNKMSRIYMVLLSEKTANPFALLDETAPVAKEEAKQEGLAKTIQIDTAGLKNRILEIPVEASDYGNLSMIGDKLYFNVYAEGKAAIKLFDLSSKKVTDIHDNAYFEISADAKKMLLAQAGKLMVVDLPVAKITPSDFIDLSGLKMMTDPKQEWKQIFDESWRQMRDYFYVDNMHGVDWKAMHDKYAVMLPYVNHRDDLNYLIGEMIGELNVGHAYVNGGDLPKKDKSDVGLLGAIINKHESGYFVIQKIVHGVSWNADLRSPLEETGLNIKQGMFILAINGQSLKQQENIYALLLNKAGKKVELTVNTTASEVNARKVLVEPIASEQALCYFNWVQDNLKKVEAASGGQIGYIHVPNMMTEGMNEFTKYFYPQLDKKAIIIDDRYNGGGNVSPIILERLQRDVTRANTSRNLQYPYPVPKQMFIGKTVMLVNQYSASDGDLFPYGYRKHNVGKIIGTRTWGGVIGIRGSLPFIDGGELRKPEFAPYSVEDGQWIIEGYGVEPDIMVDNDPAREYSGIDDQLNKAIELMQEEVKKFKPLPPVPAAPIKK